VDPHLAVVYGASGEVGARPDSQPPATTTKLSADPHGREIKSPLSGKAAGVADMLDRL
jgi:hypothetical protein